MELLSMLRHGQIKRTGYGIALWAVPYALSIPLLPLMKSDPLVFKNIMAITGLVLGSILAILYFRSVERNYLEESALLAVTWVVVNWILDFGGILPFSHQTISEYFTQIGIEYIGIMAPIVAIGYLLDLKTK
jgi:uncharacterized membrane protein YpjA